jgi:hypothetical protein
MVPIRIYTIEFTAMGGAESSPAGPAKAAPVHPIAPGMQPTIPDSDGVFGTQLFADRAAVADWSERSRLALPNAAVTIDHMGARLFVRRRRQVFGESLRLNRKPSDLSGVVSSGRAAEALRAIGSSDVERVDQSRCELELADICGAKLPAVEAEINRLQTILENRKRSRTRPTGDAPRDPLTFTSPRVHLTPNLQPMPDALDFAQ